VMSRPWASLGAVSTWRLAVGSRRLEVEGCLKSQQSFWLEEECVITSKRKQLRLLDCTANNHQQPHPLEFQGVCEHHRLLALNHLGPDRVVKVCALAEEHAVPVSQERWACWVGGLAVKAGGRHEGPSGSKGLFTHR
jgi:hypothetical protein